MRIAVLAAVLALTTPAAMAGELEDAGKAVFAKCATCHAVGPDAKNKVGPVLNGIVGRAPATMADFNYSQAMKDFGAANPVWTEQVLDTYLTKPMEMVKGTKMAFAGLPKAEDRAAVIAYLKSNP
jgi:cytochrome c